MSVVKRSRMAIMVVKEGLSSETFEEELFLLSTDVERLGGMVKKLLGERCRVR